MSASSTPHQHFLAVVDGLRRAGGHLLRTSTGHPIGDEWQYWLVGSRVVALVVFEFGPQDVRGERQVLNFDVMTGVGGGMDSAEIGKRLSACIEQDRVALAESMGLLKVSDALADAAPDAPLFRSTGSGQPNQSQDEGSKSAPAGKRRNAARTAPASALSAT